MNVYTTDKIRNVVILGHGGCGKTSLVEAMAYLSGLTNRMGKVSDGNTISDYDKEETKRLFSINTSIVPIIWEDTKINILDTPGYFDFVGEVEEAAAVADAAIIVVSGKSGIEVGTKKAWEILADAPCAVKCERDRNVLTITFEHAGKKIHIEGDNLPALKIYEGNIPLMCRCNVDKLKENKNLKEVMFTAHTEGKSLILKLMDCKQEVLTVAFARTDWYLVNLYNEANIPALPFEFVCQ